MMLKNDSTLLLPGELDAGPLTVSTGLKQFSNTFKRKIVPSHPCSGYGGALTVLRGSVEGGYSSIYIQLPLETYDGAVLLMCNVFIFEIKSTNFDHITNNTSIFKKT